MALMSAERAQDTVDEPRETHQDVWKPASIRGNLLPALVVATVPLMFFTPYSDFHFAVCDFIFPFFAANVVFAHVYRNEAVGGVMRLFAYAWAILTCLLLSVLATSAKDPNIDLYLAFSNAFKLVVGLAYALVFARYIAAKGRAGAALLLQVWTWTATIISLLTAITFVGIAPLVPSDGSRSNGYFQDANLYAGYLMISISFAVTYHLVCKSRWLPVQLVLFAVATIASASRGGVAALAVLVIAGAFLIKAYAARAVFASMAAGFVLGGIALKAGVLAGHGIAALDRLQESTGRVGIDPRLRLWARAIHLWEDHPFLGVGIGQFARFSRGDYGTLEGTDNGYIAHNTLLSFLAEMGLFGGILCVLGLLFLGQAILNNRVLSRQVRYALVLGYLATFIEMMSLNLQNLRYVWVFVGLVVGATCWQGRGSPPAKDSIAAEPRAGIPGRLPTHWN